MVSCEIADAGKYDMIIPFRWLHQEHPIKNIETPSQWRFEHENCMNHVEDEGIADMFEWDETVAFDENATMVERIGSTKEKEVVTHRAPERMRESSYPTLAHEPPESQMQHPPPAPTLEP